MGNTVGVVLAVAPTAVATPISGPEPGVAGLRTGTAFARRPLNDSGSRLLEEGARDIVVARAGEVMT